MSNIFITVGLPGSGKTVYAKTQAEKNNAVYIDGDLFKNLSELLNFCFETILNTKKKDIYLDGFFINKKIQEKIYTFFSSRFISVYWVYFEPNKENCLYNDNMRVKSGERSQSSTQIILKSEVHKPFSVCNFIKTEKYDFIYTVKEELKEDFYLEEDSTSWCTGGTIGTCWDEEGPAELSPQDELTLEEFESYTNILKHYFVDYESKIEDFNFRKYVITCNDSEADYYGGVEYFSFLRLDIRGLLEEIFRVKYKMQNFDLDKVYEQHPELFL